MHFPEGALIGGRLACLGGELGVHVHVAQGEMSPDVLDVAEVGEQLPDDRLRLAAIRAFEVGVLDDRDRGVEWPSDVISLVIDVEIEIGEWFGAAGEGEDAYSPRQSCRGAEEQPGESCGAERCGEDADLRFLERLPFEGDRGHEQSEREADACDRASAGDRGPVDGRSEPLVGQLRNQPSDAEHADWLADDVADDDPKCHRRRGGSAEYGTVERNTCVREREQRHDDVARPGMVELPAVVRSARSST